MSGIFPVNFANLSGHNARIAPSEIDKIPSKICRPGINISCGLGSKRFEFTQELSWNLLKDYLQYQGETEVVGCRGTYRRALKLGIITDGKWMDTIIDRNLSAHDYNDSKAEEISQRIVSDYYPLFRDLLAKTRGIISNIPLSER